MPVQCGTSTHLFASAPPPGMTQVPEIKGVPGRVEQATQPSGLAQNITHPAKQANTNLPASSHRDTVLQYCINPGRVDQW